MITNQPHRQLWVLGIFTLLILFIATILPATPQSTAYHQFVDQRGYFEIPNFFNVISNLALLFSGLAGLLFVMKSSDKEFSELAERRAYMVLFISIIMTCFGSIYYHLAPDNERLLWDRLPMAMGITALLAATLSERLDFRVGLRLLLLLITLGVASVLYWGLSEQQDAGNLNYYIVTQFYSLLLIILLGAFFSSRYTHGADMHIVIALYGLAKLTEYLDQEIYNVGQVISGHTLKHLLAALAIYWIVRMLKKRCLLPGEQNAS